MVARACGCLLASGTVRASKGSGAALRLASTRRCELEKVTVGIVDEHISLAPLALRGTIDLKTQRPELGCCSVKVRHFKLDMKWTFLVSQQAKSTLAEA